MLKYATKLEERANQIKSEAFRLMGTCLSGLNTEDLFKALDAAYAHRPLTVPSTETRAMAKLRKDLTEMGTEAETGPIVSTFQCFFIRANSLTGFYSFF